MEEILSSIRRIISEDGQRGPETGAPPATAAAPAPAPKPTPVAEAPRPAPAAPPPDPAPVAAPPAAEEEDVLELTEMVAEMPAVPEPAPAPIVEEPMPLPEPPAPVAAPEPQPIPEPEPEPAPPAPEPEPVIEPVAQATPQPEPQLEPEPQPVASVQQPIAEPAAAKDGRIMSQETELASAAALSILGQLIDPDRKLNEEGRQMIEAAAREKIVPLLREWIDGNLAGLIRELVREEIQRVMARAFGKES